MLSYSEVGIHHPLPHLGGDSPPVLTVGANPLQTFLLGKRVSEGERSFPEMIGVAPARRFCIYSSNQQGVTHADANPAHLL